MLSISADTASSELLTRMKGFLREILQLKMLLGKWMSAHLQPLGKSGGWASSMDAPCSSTCSWWGFVVWQNTLSWWVRRTPTERMISDTAISQMQEIVDFRPVLNSGYTPCGLDVELQSQSAWRCTFHPSAEIWKHLKALVWSDLMWFNFLFKGNSFFLLLPRRAHTEDRLIVGVFSLSYTIKHHGAIVVNWCCPNKTELNWSSYCEELLKLTNFLFQFFAFMSTNKNCMNRMTGQMISH